MYADITEAFAWAKKHAADFGGDITRLCVAGGTGREMAASYTGCSPEENPALYDSLTPANAITANTPPTNILVGAADALVPPKATYELDAALAKAGIPHQTVVIPYANHGFDIVDGNMTNCAYTDLSLRWFAQYLN